MHTFRLIAIFHTLLFATSLSVAVTGPESVSLDGTWEIVFDLENEGREAGWHLGDRFLSLENRRKISVPGAWELIEKDYEGVAFYRHEFEVPPNWSDRIVRLKFGAVNYICEVWMNGEAVGFHEGGFTPFEFRVDQVLKYGEPNVLLLRVVGPIFFGEKKVDGIGALETPQWRGGITGGIWQSVKLVATGPLFVKDVFLIPDVNQGAVDIRLELHHTGIRKTAGRIELELALKCDPQRPVVNIADAINLKPGGNTLTWTTRIPEAHLWSPENPFLYQIWLTIKVGDSVSDQWSHRFGLRELTIREKDFYLNGERIYLKAAFFEGLYPRGIAYPDSEEMVRREIRLAKEAGFNMIRPWRRPPAPMWLDLADEMGMMVVGSPALECMQLPLSTPHLPMRVENEIRQAVLRDRNRTCVVQWELFNELHRPILKQMMHSMAMMTRDLDPTRLILDESGGWAFGANMYLPDEYEPTKFNDIHNYSGAFINQQLFDAYLTIGMTEEDKEAFGFKGRTPGRNVVPGLMSYVSEVGYGSLPNLPVNNKRFREEGNPLTPAYRYYHRIEEEQTQALKDSGFDNLYANFEAFCLEQQSIHGAANKRMIEAIRSNPSVKGYCIHALSAGDWILGAGLLDLWRDPKTEAYTSTKAANLPRIVTIRMFPRNVYADQGTRLTVTGINDLEDIGAKVVVQIRSADGQVAFSRTLEQEWVHGISSLFDEQLNTSKLRGKYTVLVKITGEGEDRITANLFDFDVFQKDQLVNPDRPVAVLDLDNSLKPHLDRMEMAYMEFTRSTSLSLPVFVTSVQPKGGKETERFRDLETWIKAGGTAVYISGTGIEFDRTKLNQVRSVAVPFSANVEHGQGLWTCIPHLVKDHPIFAGLPVGGAMREIYENVWARQTLRNLGGEAVVATVGFEWFSHDHKLHYRGPGESWWGADLGIIQVGEGRSVVSMMRIVENLGKDPVADKLFHNLITYASP